MLATPAKVILLTPLIGWIMREARTTKRAPVPLLKLSCAIAGQWRRFGFVPDPCHALVGTEQCDCDNEELCGEDPVAVGHLQANGPQRVAKLALNEASIFQTMQEMGARGVPVLRVGPANAADAQRIN